MSHVSSQPEMIPSSLSLLSRDKRLPVDTRNQSEFTQRLFSKISIWWCAKKQRSSPWSRKEEDYSHSEDRQNQGTIPRPTFATRPLTTSSTIPVEFPQNSMVRQQRQQISELQLDKFHNPQSFSVWTDNSIQNTTHYLFWFSIGCYVVDQRSGDGRFSGWVKILAISSWIGFSELQDAGREDCFCFEEDHPEFPSSRRRSASRSRKPQKEDRFLRGRQIAFMIYDYFRVIGALDTVLDYADLFSATLHDGNFQGFDTRWDEVLLSISKIPSDDILESLYNLRIRESAQLKTVLELYDTEIHQKISMPKISKIEDNGKEEYSTKLRRKTRENWNRSSGQELTGNEWRWRRTRNLLSVESKMSVFERRPMQFPAREKRSCLKTRTHCRHTFWANRITRSKCVEEEKYPRQK